MRESLDAFLQSQWVLVPLFTSVAYFIGRRGGARCERARWLKFGDALVRHIILMNSAEKKALKDNRDVPCVAPPPKDSDGLGCNGGRGGSDLSVIDWGPSRPAFYGRSK